MMRIFTTPEFDKQYKKLPPHIQKKAEKQEYLFRQNPFHPSLRLEKLAPKNQERWSIRIDRNYRIILHFIEKDKALFLVCGHHNWIYNIKF